MESNRGNRVAFMTLGCKLNYSETSSIARQFVEHGYDKVKPGETADVYVINTCSVTEHADKKCRTAIRKMHKLNPNAIIAVTGCYAQLNPQEILSIEGVDLVLGADEKSNLFVRVSGLKKDEDSKGVVHSASRAYSCAISEVETIFPAYSSDDRTRSFLKVQDGCDYHCSYCTIPLARGKSRNHSIEFILKEAGDIVSRGIKEVVLTGVNTGDFGKSTGERFEDLLRALDGVEGLKRIRISSIEPNLLSEEILKFISKSKKFLPHFHIPLQSGSNKILAAMKRRYNRELFLEKILLIRRYMPFAFIGVDVIVGFPGETSEDFADTFEFLESVSPSFLHVFPYSRRANTPAAEYSGQVRERDKSERVEALTKLSDKLYFEFKKMNIGRKEEVLYESTQKGGMMYGYTRNYIKVEREYDMKLIGEITEVVIG
jgi:threonylcarbamoyladenosine tRNA methylthiotransferase MtaB